MSQIPCEHLEWDTEFFGIRIARVTTSSLDDATAARVVEWARAESVDCLYYLADAVNPESGRAAERAGFRLVDFRVTLAREAGEVQVPPQPNLNRPSWTVSPDPSVIMKGIPCTCSSCL